jgi:lysozyme
MDKQMKFAAFDHLATWEGLRLTSYRDGGGVWTIGYGHTGPDVYAGKTISLEEAKRLAAVDIEEASGAVNSGVKVELTQNQFDALVSLTYNIGNTAFLRSTCLKKLNVGDYNGAAEALTWWNKDNGKVIPGLVNRRKAEKELFLTPDSGERIEERVDRLEIELKELKEKLRNV